MILRSSTSPMKGRRRRIATTNSADQPGTSTRRSARIRQKRLNQNTQGSPIRKTVIGNTLSLKPPPAPAVPCPQRKRKRDEGLEHEALEETTSAGRKLKCTPRNRSVHSKSDIIPLEHWVIEKRWPKEQFQANAQTREDLEQDSWYKNNWECKESMSHILARQRLTPSLRRKLSQSSDATLGPTTASDQNLREAKSSSYQDGRYDALLALQGVYLRKDDLGVTEPSKKMCHSLLNKSQSVPQDSLFRDDLFDQICQKIQAKNEALVIQDISRLIVPSAQNLAIYGAKHLQHLVESVNDGWNNCIPITKTRPQPDYAIGFGRSAFTEKQLQKLKPFIGGLADTSYFMATYYLYFPFLTCEVKCGTAALDIADRQNAHSMTIAVRAVIELFRLVQREKELHREILSFSISHDHQSVRLYGHYACINGKSTSFYRHPIYNFDFTTLEGKDKWTAYKFTKNIYDLWMPMHLERICSAIDQIPDSINFDVSQQSEFHFEENDDSQVSQELLGILSQQSEGETSSQASFVGSQDVTPDTSMSNRSVRTFKKPRNKSQG